jgi:hypothetical protein
MFTAEAIEQREHLCLNAHVERSGGFVSNQQDRGVPRTDLHVDAVGRSACVALRRQSTIRTEGKGDGNSLPQASGELVWPLTEALANIGNGDVAQRLLGAVTTQPALAEQPTHPHGGIQCAERVLEHGTEEMLTHAAPLRLGTAEHVDTADRHLTLHRGSRSGHSEQA